MERRFWGVILPLALLGLTILCGVSVLRLFLNS
jgi:hypothetical protein